MRSLWILGGSSSRSFTPNSGTSGLWSVSMWKSMPTRKSEKRSHAHVTARVSFSIWAYLLSVSLRAREAYATGFSVWSSCFCSRTAPKAYEDESADTTVYACVLYSAMTGGLLSSPLMLSSACCWGCPHVHIFFTRRRSRSGCVFSASSGMYFPRWFTMPTNHLSPLTLLGSSMAATAFILFGSALLYQPCPLAPSSPTTDVCTAVIISVPTQNVYIYVAFIV